MPSGGSTLAKFRSAAARSAKTCCADVRYGTVGDGGAVVVEEEEAIFSAAKRERCEKFHG